MPTMMPYISDAKLIPRIQKYLDDNKLTLNVNIELMAASLQKTYVEYSRKKKAPFRMMVSKAYYVLQKDYLLKESDEGDISQSKENGEKIYSKDEMVGEEVNSEGTPVINGQKRKLDEPQSIQVGKKKKISRLDIKPDVPDVTFKNMIGVDDIHETINEDILLWLTEPFQLGYLLHGHTGSGKTLLAHAIAGNYNLPLMKITAPELVDGVSGNSEKLIRNLFKKASSFSPCVLFIDKLDTITNTSSSQKEMQGRMVGQMNSCLDDLRKDPSGQKVILIGATSNLDSVDISLRVPGRFSTEINLDILDEESRIALLKLHCSHLNLDPNIDWKLIETPGYNGNDLREIALRVWKISNNRFLKQNIEEILKQENGAISQNLLESITKQSKLPVEVSDKLIETIQKHGFPELKKYRTVTCDDFIAAVKEYQPLSVREGMASVPRVSWDDVGSLKELRKELVSTLMATIKHRKHFERSGIVVPKGVLLCGPPGCGKTLVAKALANEASLNFISVNGPELLNKYVGESERAVRSSFEKAKKCAPCIIFFDEIDSLCPNRTHGQNEVSSRVVAQMLTAMDGVQKLEGVFILAATNRPDIIDPAILRAGRFDKILYVDLPSADDRVEILKTVTRNITPPLGPDIDLECIGRSEKLSGFSGADLTALVSEAFRIGVDRSYVDNCDFKVTTQDFDMAISKRLASSVTKKGSHRRRPSATIVQTIE